MFTLWYGASNANSFTCIIKLSTWVKLMILLGASVLAVQEKTWKYRIWRKQQRTLWKWIRIGGVTVNPWFLKYAYVCMHLFMCACMFGCIFRCMCMCRHIFLVLPSKRAKKVKSPQEQWAHITLRSRSLIPFLMSQDSLERW